MSLRVKAEDIYESRGSLSARVDVVNIGGGKREIAWCELHPLINTFGPSILTARYGGWVSSGKAWIKVCNVHSKEISSKIHFVTIKKNAHQITPVGVMSSQYVL